MTSTTTPPGRRVLLATIFFTIFLDLVGVGIATPIIAPLVLRPESGLLPADYSEHSRTILLGFLIATFSIAGFFFGPLLGALSDRYGRKRVLLLSLSASLVGYLIFALGIHWRDMTILFISRIVYGIGGANIPIIQSAISDVSDAESRTKNFGLVGIAFGLGFIIGPALGGELANSSVVPWFNFTTPFLAAALLTLVNILLVIRNFPETLRYPIQRPISPFTGIANLRQAFTDSRLRILFFAVFFYAIGFNFYTQFFQVLLIKRFDYGQAQIGRYFAYVGVWVALMQGTVVRRAANQYTSAQILRVSVLGLAVALWLFVLPTRSWQLFLVVPLMAFFQGLTSPNSTTIVSQSADAQEQGKILGINQSILSAAFAIPPVIAAYIDTIDIYLPIVVAGTLVFVGWLFFLRFTSAEAKPSAG